MLIQHKQKKSENFEVLIRRRGPEGLGHSLGELSVLSLSLKITSSFANCRIKVYLGKPGSERHDWDSDL